MSDLVSRCCKANVWRYCSASKENPWHCDSCQKKCDTETVLTEEEQVIYQHIAEYKQRLLAWINVEREMFGEDKIDAKRLADRILEKEASDED